MPSPFPGMDPYLEDPEIWRGFHHHAAEELINILNPLIGPRYFADVEIRVVAEEVHVATTHTMVADAGVEERQRLPGTGAVESPTAISEAPVRRTVAVPDRTKLRAVRIALTETGQIVMSIEILSPYNKRPGEGLYDYRQKRARILRSSVHLIEIDLLRGGERPGREVNEPPLDADYVVLVNRASGEDIRTSEIWPLALSDALPVIPVPLLPPDPDVPLALGVALASIYKRAGYEWRIDYTRPVPPPEPRPAMKAWLAKMRPELGG